MVGVGLLRPALTDRGRLAFVRTVSPSELIFHTLRGQSQTVFRFRMTMGDAENTLPPSKKRAAGREISRDNPGLDDEEDTSEQGTGTFKRASDEVLASRRILKVRRNQGSSTPSPNPFANIRLVSSDSNSMTSAAYTEVEIGKKAPEIVDGNNNAKGKTDDTNVDTAQPADNKTENEVKTEIIANENTVNDASASEMENEKERDGVEADNDDNKGTEGESAEKKNIEKAKEGDKPGENKNIEGKSAEGKEKKETGSESMEKTRETAAFSSFQQLSSGQNAFSGLVGTGFSSSTFSFGILKDGNSASCSTGSLFGQPSVLNIASNGSSLLGAQEASTDIKSKGIGFPSMQEVPAETGEENEKVAFTAESVLFEFLEGGWKERGKGELKVNVPTSGTGKARLVMRTRGNYRLILNASLYPDMKLTNMDKKGITFSCINSSGEGKVGFSTFALKFKEVSLVEEFRSVVIEHKGKTTAVLKTTDNSPKASD